MLFGPLCATASMQRSTEPLSSHRCTCAGALALRGSPATRACVRHADRAGGEAQWSPGRLAASAHRRADARAWSPHFGKGRVPDSVVRAGVAREIGLRVTMTLVGMASGPAAHGRLSSDGAVSGGVCAAAGDARCHGESRSLELGARCSSLAVGWAGHSAPLADTREVELAGEQTVGPRPGALLPSRLSACASCLSRAAGAGRRRRPRPPTFGYALTS
jgi:hypothetical protein